MRAFRQPANQRFIQLPAGARLLRAIVFGLACLALFASPRTLWAGGAAENVLLVVNADSASSKLIANHYIAARELPARNVVYLSGIPDREIVNLSVFRDSILLPVLREVEARKLAKSIDYIVYSADFPTIVNNGSHVAKLKEILKKQTGKDVDGRLFNGNASINSMTYFAGAVIEDDPGYMALDSNSYYRHPAGKILFQPFHGEQQEKFKATVAQLDAADQADFDAAIDTLLELAAKNPQQVAVAHWLAKFYGKRGDAKSATKWLTQAYRLGWHYRSVTAADPAFENVAEDPLFKGILDRLPDEKFDFVPTHGFRHIYSWGPNGFPNSEPGQGNRHFLSTVLAVTRNHGTTEVEALDQLLRTMKADESKPEGTFYFTETPNVRSTTRKPNVRYAIDALEELGHQTEIVNTVIPRQAIDVIGLTCGTSQFNWVASGSKIRPGAICDNLTSHGGMLHRASQTKLSSFIANGAAGASGTVIEPYALQAKFPHPMLHVHYARGCSLAEAFYQSVHGPMQLLIVGDPLCQPFATKPVLKVEGVKPWDVVSGKTTLKLDASESPVEIAGVELYVDGVVVSRMRLQEAINFDSTSMTDGFHEIRLVAIANNAIETAGHVVLPMLVDNRGISTKLTAEHKDWLETDTIPLQASSNYGDSIELMHNGRAIAKKIGREAEFSISAKLLGRGPVRLEAVAIAESGKTVASAPIWLEIKGRLADRKRDTEAKPKPKPRTPDSKAKPGAGKSTAGKAK